MISRINNQLPTRGVYPWNWSAKNALFPNLWYGLVGAWIPSLGVSGIGTNSIVDISCVLVIFIL